MLSIDAKNIPVVQ